VSKLVAAKADVAAYRTDLLKDDFDWKQVAAEREA
jgi:hypothetical protein